MVEESLEKRVTVDKYENDFRHFLDVELVKKIGKRVTIEDLDRAMLVAKDDNIKLR
jgi:hypothetical protein